MDVNFSDFKRFTGLSIRSIKDYIESGMPVKSRTGQQGKAVVIDSCEAFQWLINHYGERKGKKLTERERLAMNQADKVALENAQKRGELIPVEVLQEVLGAAFADHGAQLDGLAGRLANELAGINEPARIRLRLLEECRRIRSSLAGSLAGIVESEPGPQERGPDPAAATQSDGKRVGGRQPSAPTGKRGARSVAK